jgi:hypothetical protein
MGDALGNQAPEVVLGASRLAGRHELAGVIGDLPQPALSGPGDRPGKSPRRLALR